MKKFLVVLTLLLSKGFSLPVGNPSEASFFYCNESSFSLCDECDLNTFIDFRLGFYGDYVFNRHFQTGSGRQIDYTQMNTNAAYVALNFVDKVDVFGTLGASQLCFNTSFAPFNSDNPRPRLDYTSTTTFSWSVGARTTIWEWKCLAAGIEGQYFSFFPKAKVLFLRDNVDAYPDEGSRRHYWEWQLGGGISLRYNSYFMPYVAVKYARAQWNFKNQLLLITGTPALFPSLENSNHWGCAIGMTFLPFGRDSVYVTAEGRFGDEKALYVNGRLYF